MFSEKKGSIQDLFMIGIVLLLFTISILVGFKLIDSINTKIQDIPIINSNANSVAVSAKVLNYFPTTFDNAFLFLTIGLMIVTLVLASLVRIHPIFLILFVIALVFLVFFSGILSEIYQEMAANENLAPQADQLFFISHIMTYLPLFVGIFGVILMIVSYKLWKNAEDVV